MKQLLNKAIFGNDTRTSGVMALAIIMLIALGCTCGKNFDLGNLGGDGNNGSNRQSDSADTGDTKPGNTSAEPENDFPFPGSTTETGGDTVPGDFEMEALVKETTADFALAVAIENFALIHAKSSSDFQSSYSSDEMKNAFKTFIEQKSRLLPSLNNAAMGKPKFTPPPHIRYDNNIAILVADGEFATKPYGIKFEYEYVYRDGEWKMLKLVIKM